MRSPIVTVQTPPSRDLLAEMMALPEQTVSQAVLRSRFYRLRDHTFSWNLAFDNEFAKFPLTI